MTIDIVNQHRRLRRAAAHIPKPVPWDWAAPRLLPMLAGPRIDPPDMPLVRAIVDPGCAFVFALRVGGAAMFVDRLVAERWECSVDQLLETGMANLRRRCARIGPRAVSGATFSGRILRVYESDAASSLLLVREELVRLFGRHDQIFAAPNLSTLISFPIDCPSDVIGSIVIDFEMGSAWPLMLDPFLLEDGGLSYQPDDFDVGP